MFARCLLLLVSWAAHADGYFSAKNVINGDERPILGEGFDRLDARLGRVEILSGSIVLVSGPVLTNGLFFLGTVYVPDPGPTAVLTIRIWNLAYGATFYQAQKEFNGSQLLTVPVHLSSGTEPPASLENFPTVVWLGQRRYPGTEKGYFTASNQLNGDPQPLLAPDGAPLAAAVGRVEVVVDGRVIASDNLIADGAFDLGYLPVPGHLAGEWVNVTIRAWDRTSGDVFGMATRRASRTFQVGLGYIFGPHPLPVNLFRSFALEESAVPLRGTLTAIAPVGAQPSPVLDRHGNPLSASVGMVELLWNGQVIQSGKLSGDGQMNLGTLSILGAAPGSVVDLTVRAWDLSTGATYDSALARGTVTFPIGPLGGEGNPPATLASMPWLMVTYPAPIFAAQAPSISTVAVGSAATIPVQVEGLELNFHWQIQTAKSNWVDLTSAPGIEDITNSVLRFPVVATTHRGTYRLRVWNSLTNYYSPPTRLEVQVPQTFSLLGISSLRFGSDSTLRIASTSLLPVSATLASGPAVILSQNDAEIQVHPTGAGTLIVHAVQAGDPLFQSAETNFVIPILPAAQSLTFNGPADTMWSPEGQIPLAAVSSSGLPTTFRIASGPARIEGTTLRLLDTGVGPVTVIAEQTGSASYEPAIPVARTFVVTKATQTVHFDPIPDPTDTDPALLLNATASSGLPVVFKVMEGPARLGASQHLELTGPGSVRIAAIQSGTATYEPASSEQRFAVIATPRDVRLVNTAQRLQLMFRGEQGRLHRIESAGTLGGEWLEVDSILAEGLDHDTLIQILSTADSTRFFRVRLK